jgi:hypothetical protein
MYPTLSTVRTQQKLIQARRSNNDCYRIFNLLTSEDLLDRVEEQLPDHRERLFPPTETLAMFITQALSADRSCQNIVNQAAMQRLISGLPSCSTHTGGYCRARVRLPLPMIKNLSQSVGELVNNITPDLWRWKNRDVQLVDGTTVTMPDTANNQRAYPQQRGQKPGLGFPICRIVGITSLSSGALLNAAVGRFNGKGGDEQTLLRSLQDTFKTGDIVLGDAFFSTYFFITAMQAKGVDILLEQHGARRRTTDFRCGKKLGKRDHLIVIAKPKNKPYWMRDDDYQAAPNSTIIRECKVDGKILITTMICPKVVHKDELKSLYKKRWSVELDIRHIKDTMGMNILSCKTPDMALKEIWVHLLAYNLLRLMMTQAALIAGITPRQMSFKHCLQLWLASLYKLNVLDEEQLNSLLLLMSQQRVGNRPGRIEPRAVKRRPKAFPLLTKPRELARENVRTYGHPKKLK